MRQGTAALPSGANPPPALTRRVARGLALLYDRFHGDNAVDWFLIADDDTFVRWRPLRAYLATLDARRPMMVGAPVPSERFLTRAARARRGGTTHCGGNAWALSAPALAALRPALARCVAARDVVLSWYYDEIVLGRCLHELLGLECVALPGVVSVGAGGGDGPPTTGLGEATTPDHPAMLAQHPALPADMARLRATFDEAVDDDWLRRFHAASPADAATLANPANRLHKGPSHSATAAARDGAGWMHDTVRTAALAAALLVAIVRMLRG